MNYLAQGLVMGFAYVAPIGMQNMYVINSALNYSRKRLLLTVLLTILNDISLAIFCFLGIGSLISKITILSPIISYAGFVALLYIAYNVWKADPSSNKDNQFGNTRTFLTPFIVTWLNPQAIMDGSLILGSMYSRLTSQSNRLLFILGFSAASFLWFSFLAIIIHINKNKFSIKAQIILNKISAIILFYFGMRLIIK